MLPRIDTLGAKVEFQSKMMRREGFGDSATDAAGAIAPIVVGEGLKPKAPETLKTLGALPEVETTQSVRAVSTEPKMASADVRKFSEYIFKPGAEHGKDKVFRSLGYSEKDSAKLAQIWEKQATEKFASGEFTLGKKDEFGQRINIEIRLEGTGDATGKISYLKSGWMKKEDGTITLNTPFSGFTK